MTNIIAFDRVLKHTERPYLDKTPEPHHLSNGGREQRAIMPSIAQHFPERVSTYYEFFVGGGAVFFIMANRIDRAVLSDKNEELVLTYNAVKNDLEDLIKLLREHAKNHRKDEYYLRVRKQAPVEAIEIAARFIYLNKTCYMDLEL